MRVDVEKRKYSYGSEHWFDKETNQMRGKWTIIFMPKGYLPSRDAKVVWESEYIEGDYDRTGEPPARVRAEYERLIGYDPATWQNEGSLNVVELIASGSEDDDCAFDQPCKWGHRVEDHAVYCHNPTWLYAPRKCRRRQEDSWSGKAWPHEQCPGFCANPNATA